MTVGELINLLEQYPKDAEIEHWESEFGGDVTSFEIVEEDGILKI